MSSPLPPRAASTPAAPLAASALALARLGEPASPLWRAGQMARIVIPAISSGWSALDAELPGGGWPLAGLSELLVEPASGELALLAPGLRALGQRELGAQELLWVAPPWQPCVAALQALGLALPRLVCLDPATAADAAWACEQGLRAGSCAAVLWWSGSSPVAAATLRRLHLAGQAGATPLFAVRPSVVRAQSSPAPLRLACTPLAGRRLAVEVFKRRGPPMAAPLTLALSWPASARSLPSSANEVVRDAVDCPAPAAPAVASPALVTAGL